MMVDAYETGYVFEHDHHNQNQSFCLIQAKQNLKKCQESIQNIENILCEGFDSILHPKSLIKLQSQKLSRKMPTITDIPDASPNERKNSVFQKTLIEFNHDHDDDGHSEHHNLTQNSSFLSIIHDLIEFACPDEPILQTV